MNPMLYNLQADKERKDQMRDRIEKDLEGRQGQEQQSER